MAPGNDDERAIRINKILQLCSSLVNGAGVHTGKQAEDHESLDKIISGLQSLAEHLNDKSSFIEERTSRLNEMLDVLLQYTLMDFSQKISIGPRGDEVDAVSLGINTLGEELDSHISQLKEKTNELTRSNKQLEEFVFIASHDLQEPLKTLTNYTNLLQEDAQSQLGENATGYLTKVTAATERMRTLLIDLLEFGRVGREPVIDEADCNVLINEVLADIAASIESSHATINVQQLPVVRGNLPELKSLFQNLLSNALKFKKPGVLPVINVSVSANKNDWTFAIEDNGIGIEEQFYERIFAIFQKLHSRKEYQGTGIGLAHCKKVVEHHQGNIWLKSVLGKGSTFYFTIPKTEEK